MNISTSETNFTKNQSLLTKGVACFLMFIHHLLNSNYYSYISILPANIMDNIVIISKVSVILFLVISGYGLCEQYKKLDFSIISSFKFSINHILKLYLSYWFIFIIFIPLGYVFGTSPLERFYSGSFFNLLSDFLGVSYLLKTPMANRTWWYVPIILIYYLIFPVAYQIIHKLKQASWGLFLLMAGYAWIFVGKCAWYIYFIPFLLGMLLSEFQAFYYIYVFWKKTRISRALQILFYLCIWSVYIFFRIKYLNLRTFYYVFDWVPALLIILLIRQITFPKPIGDIFRLLGEHSGNILCAILFFIRYTRGIWYIFLNIH